MRSHYEKAAELMREADLANTHEQAVLLTAMAQVHATLALVDATRES